ncbi:MAG TPA: PCRF domain-containing protein, partial [Chthoniobacterales bacterium]
MDFNLLIERKRERFQQLESEIGDPHLFNDRKRASEIMREHSGVKGLLAKWEELQAARRQLIDNRALAGSNEPDLAQMAQDEIPALEKRIADYELEIQLALLPPDENE